MPKLLFGQSYYLRFDPRLWEAMMPYPPLGTLYAASLMRKRGFDVSLFDSMLADSEAEWGAALDRERPDAAVLFEDNFNYLSKMCLLNMREAAFTMIGMARERGVPVIVAGADASDHPDLYLQAGADYAIIGEGEITLGEILAWLTGRIETPPHQIAGLAYMAEGSLHRTSPRPVIRDLDALPFPAWDLIDVDRYRRIWRERHGYHSMNMATTRGCPYHCNWCAKPIWGQRYQVRSPQNVAEELTWLQQAYGPDHIWFVDDIMGLRPGWWVEFAEILDQRGACIPFKCLSRADLITREADLAVLKRAGCQIVWLGAESGSQKILNAMEKGTTVEQIREAARRLHEAGIQVGFFLQFGYPGETREDIEMTLQLVRECQPDDIGMSVSYPLPGTRFYDNVRLQLDERQNWTDSADLAMLYQGPFRTEFYRQLHRVLHLEYRARRGWRSLSGPEGCWSVRGLREVAAVIYRWMALPLARARLNHLARLPHRAPALLPHMSLEAAAQPSAQGD